jgi:hypothetical protein
MTLAMGHNLVVTRSSLERVGMTLARARNYRFCRTHELHRGPRCDRRQQLAVLIEFDLTEFHFLFCVRGLMSSVTSCVVRAVRLVAGFNRRCPSTILGLSIWDFWREKWYMDRTSPYTHHCTSAV